MNSRSNKEKKDLNAFDGMIEDIIVACHEKADEIDDSSGDFGMLVENLFLDWIKSRQAANHDPDETAKLLCTHLG
jgi:hypothetical protein